MWLRVKYMENRKRTKNLRLPILRCSCKGEFQAMTPEVFYFNCVFFLPDTDIRAFLYVLNFLVSCVECFVILQIPNVWLSTCFVRNEALRVAFIDEVETLKDGKVQKEFYSKLVKADINGKDKVRISQVLYNVHTGYQLLSNIFQ